MSKMTQQPQDDRSYLSKLRSFCLAAQVGNFSRAAEALYLSQPTVSLQIQSLEAQFRTTLFQRRGPKITLTPDGQALYDLAWPVVNALDSLQVSFFAKQQGLQTGWVNIAAGEATILHLLPEYVQEYAASYPGVELKLHNVTGRDGLRMLRSDAVDFAVGSMIEVPSDIVYQPIFTYDPMLIAPQEHALANMKRITIKDISRYPLILPPRSLTTWQVVDYVFQKHNLNYRVALEVGGWEVIKKYVEAGLGISIVTSICLKGTEPLTALNVSRWFPRRTYGLVLRKHKVLSAQAARFIALIKRPRPVP